jgi:hypothetical protein
MKCIWRQEMLRTKLMWLIYFGQALICNPESRREEKVRGVVVVLVVLQLVHGIVQHLLRPKY